MSTATGSPRLQQAFAFIGSAAFGGVAGQLRFEQTGNTAGTLPGDVSGDGMADFALQVVGVASMLATDFVL